jgi:hypothetical protein
MFHKSYGVWLNRLRFTPYRCTPFKMGFALFRILFVQLTEYPRTPIRQEKLPPEEVGIRCFPCKSTHDDTSLKSDAHDLRSAELRYLWRALTSTKKSCW